MLELVIGGHLIAFAALLISGARLGQSHGYPGLTLVPWVAAFGLAGQLVRRLTPLALPLAPVSGCLLLAASYAAISLALFGGHHDEAFLIVLLAAGGLGWASSSAP